MAVVRTDTDSLGSLTVKHQTGDNTRDLDKVDARNPFVSRQDICMAAVSPHNTLNELYVFTRYKTSMKGSMFLRDLFKLLFGCFRPSVAFVRINTNCLLVHSGVFFFNCLLSEDVVVKAGGEKHFFF